MANHLKEKPVLGGKVLQVTTFKWKTETIYLPIIVITSELRRVANEHLKSRQAQPKKDKDSVTENAWNPTWDEKGEDDLISSSKDPDGENKAETLLAGQESPRKKKANTAPTPEPATKSNEKTSADPARKEKKDSAATVLMKQKLNDRKELFKNLMEGASDRADQPLERCGKCNEDYRDEDSHRKVCSQEGKFSSQSTFRTFDIRSKPTELKCLECGKTFQKRIHLTLHQKIHASMDKPVLRPVTRSFKCNFCDRLFERNDDLVSHYQRQHNISSNVHMHQLRTGNISSSAEKPKNVQLIGDEFYCEKCGRKFNTWNQVNLHGRICKANAKQQQERKVESEIQSILNGDSIWNSMSASSDAREPDDSGDISDDSTNLVILNTRSVNETSGEIRPPPPPSPPKSCDDNTFAAEENKMPYECSHCARSFRFRHHLDFHEMGHYQTCASCKQRLPDNEYSIHSETCSTKHSQEEEQQHRTCEKCNISFNSDFLLRQHLLVHRYGLESFVHPESEEFQVNLPFRCLIVKCANRFSHLSDRDLHIEQKHSSENVGRCEECGRIFCSVFNLMRHRSSDHNLNSPFADKTKDEKIFAVHPTYYYIQQGFRHTKPPNPHVEISDEDKLRADEALEKLTSDSSPSSSSATLPEPVKEEDSKKKYGIPLAFLPRMTRAGRKLGRRPDIPIQSIYTCETCNKTYTQSQRNLYLMHLADHKREEKFKCHLCNQKCLSERRLQQHIKRHDNPAYVPGLRRRTLQRPEIPIQSEYTCKTCNKTFDGSERTLYMQHLLNHKFSCHLCHVKCSTEKMLQMHIERHSDPTYIPSIPGRGRFRVDVPIQDSYTCETCGKKFSKSERTPYLLHIDDHKYPCQLCDRSYRSEILLQQHLKRHEDPSYVPGQQGRFRADVPIQDSYTCETCGKTFTKLERTSYLLHIDDHKYPCQLCDRSYRSKTLLQQHLKRHEDPNYIPGRPSLRRADIPVQESYTCETCGKIFNKSERTSYIIHIDEHKYTCQLCDRSFRTDALFQQHLKRHEDPSYVPGQHGNFRADVPIQDSYTCEICNKTFTKSERTSYIIHIDEHKYTCQLCNRSCRTETLLQQHLKRHEDPNYVPGQRYLRRADIPVQDSYTCETCGKVFAKSERTPYILHIDEHKYPCHLCDRSYRTEVLLQQHVKRHEDPSYVPGQRGGRYRTDIPVQNSYACEICGKTYKKSERNPYLIHLAHHKRLEKFKCHLCNRKHLSEKLLQQHMKRHDDPRYVPGRRLRTDIPFQKEYTCETCDRKFNDRTLYIGHIYQHKIKDPLACKICNQRFTTKDDHQDHMQQHDDPSFNPDWNDDTSEKRGRPRIRIDIPDQESYTCKMCSRMFNERRIYIMHLTSHQRAQRYTCKLCTLQFQSNFALEQHLKRHEDPSYVPRKRIRASLPRIPIQDIYTCEICPKKYSKRNSFIVHMYQHRRQEKFGCHLCERKFISSALLHQHLRKHLDPAFRSRQTLKGQNRGRKRGRPGRTDIPYQDVYNCEHCGGRKSFTNRMKYLLHIRYHFLEENFACPHCPRRFKVKTLLTHHLETHNSNKGKTHECKDCLKKFRTKTFLSLHSKKFCKKIPCNFQCSLCEDRFHSTLQLENHHSRLHADKKDKGSKENEGAENTDPPNQHPCPHCRQSFNTSYGLTRHIFVYHPTSESAINAKSNLLGLFRSETNARNQDGQHVVETDSGSPANDLAQPNTEIPSENSEMQPTDGDAGHNQDQNMNDEDDDDYGYDISDMLATDFCETEMNEPEPSPEPSFPKHLGTSRAAPPKRTYSRIVCMCGKSMKYKSQKNCHNKRCPCVQASKQCGRKCKCSDDNCLNSRHLEEEQQQMFKAGRENMIQEDQSRQNSTDSNHSFEDEELEDELPVPMESTSSAPIMVGQFSSGSGNQPSTSMGYSSVMMSSEFIAVDDNEDANFINEDDDVDPLADTDPLQTSEPSSQEVTQVTRSQPASHSFVTNSAPVPYGVRTVEPGVSTPSFSPMTPTTTMSFQNFIAKTITTALGFTAAEPRLSTSTSSAPTPVARTADISVSNPIDSLHNFSQSASLRCQVCKKIFKTMPTFISHFLVHGGDFGAFSCPICTKEFTFLSEFINHMDLHNKGLFIQCTKCSSRFTTYKEMDKHLLVHHFKPMECGLCSVKFATSSEMMTHWSKLHATCQCGLCNVKFFSYDDLTFHMKSLHSPYDCVHCGARFEKVTPLMDHFLEKHYIDMYGKKTKPATPTLAPTAIPNPPTPAPSHKYKLKCDYCGLLFSDHEALSYHLTTHLPQIFRRSEKPNNFPCDKCGAQFSDSVTLNSHLHQHMTYPQVLPKPVKPPVQSTSSTPQVSKYSAIIGDPNSSDVYLTFISGKPQTAVQQEAPQPDSINDNLNAVEVFTCPKCFKTFNSKRYWMSHLRSYDSPLCSACGTLFDKRDDLIRHLENKDGRNLPICVVYECRYCLQNFTQTKFLSNHLKKHERATVASASTDSVPIIVASTSLAPQKQQGTSSDSYEMSRYLAVSNVRSQQQQPQEIEEITLDSD